ncbi:MAG: hypothetical protein ACYTF9_01530 [Planctomycetota bacterium]|jgi:hypothetical protein
MIKLDALATLVPAILVTGALAQSIEIDLVAIEGDAMSGSTVATLNAPFTNGNGQVSFVAALADSTRTVWFDTGPLFNSAEALPDTLTGGESTHGASDAGGFIYSPSFNGEDSVYTSSGLLVRGDDPAPGLDGLFVTFASRPTMLPNGTAHWVGGWTDAPGGSTQGDVVYRAADPSDPSSAVPLLVTGDMVDGMVITDISFGYDFSDDGKQHIQEVTLAGSDAVLVNGALFTRAGDPTGDGDNWDNFDSPCINGAGTTLFTGDTDGDTDSDEFLAIDGVIRLREGDMLDGRVLGSAVDAASINELGQIVFLWDTDEGETLFFGPASDPASSVAVVWIGALVDCGDSCEFELADFNASNVIGPGLDLAEDGRVFVEVDLGPDSLEAIIGLDLPTANDCPADVTGDGVVDVQDLVEVILQWGAAGGPADVNGDGIVDAGDLDEVTLAWGAC